MFELELSRITQMLVERYGLRVLNGPFAGMRYVPQAVGSALVPKLIGSYESELHPTLLDLMSQHYDRVVNVGCGEGYYAVGIARQIPEVPVYAFDSDPDAQRLCAELARLNGVADRVTISGACTPECLGPLVGPQTLLVCDCEGAEIDLLHPDRLPGLAQCEMLVELHDCYNPSISLAITERFSSTHSITWIDATERDAGMFDTQIAAIDASAPSSGAVAPLSELTESDRLLALAEFRPPGMRWAYLTPARKCASAVVPSPRTGECVPIQERGTEPGFNVEVSISGCILARNEERRIEDALRSLQPWTCQIIVIDNESEDDTVAIARRYTDHILTAPRSANFDAVRNRAIDVAVGDWVFYLDADERVPARLGHALVQLVRERGHEFEALCIPFKHYFCGKWMEHSGWWPGYTRPQLLKKGRFRYNERLHSGVAVDGRTFYFPADDADLAIVHYSYDSLDHYLEKLNRYTHGEAENLLADSGTHSWQAMLAHFVHDWQAYYERGRADLDGMHGFVLAFMSAFYRFASRAKLWDLRRQRGELAGPDPVPGSLREMLEFMAQVTQHGAEPWLTAPKGHGAPAPGRVPLLWRAPLLDPSGFADESRNFVLGLIEAGEPVALAPEQWGDEDAGLSAGTRALIREHTVPPDTPAELCALHTLLAFQQPAPNASFSIARTMFETDRLPAGAAQRLNAMDRIWVPSEFNRETFMRSGVDPEKISVVPEAIDAEPFAAAGVEPWQVPGSESYRFLSVFDWTLHKGWDLLLEAFAHEFGADSQVGLILKVWSSNHYTMDDIRRQADLYLQAKLGRPLVDFPNIHLWREIIPTGEMPRLYRAVNAFVLPTRGEGWCRPLMEAMAAGLPTIATAWSGLTAFHHAGVGYPLPYRLMPVSPAGAREIPIYGGHCWAEPDLTQLRRLMRQVVQNPDDAREKGLAAQRTVVEQFSRPAVAAILREEIALCRELAGLKATSDDVSSDPAALHRDAILIQCARGSHTRLLDLTCAHHEAYARDHGMDYLCRYGYHPADRAPGWDKIALLLEVLQQGSHELIIWLDADAMIADPLKDLRDALPHGKWLGMVQCDPPHYNDGVMYVRNTPQSLAFFQEVWETWPVDHPWEDNAAVIQVLERESSRWDGVVTLADEWNSTCGVNESASAVVRAWHGYGTADGLRLEAMRDAMEELERQGARDAGKTSDGAAGSRPGHPGRRARGPVPLRPSANPVPLDSVTPVNFRDLLGRPLRVRWEGGQAFLSSLALVNRELCLQLLAAGDVELAIDDPAHPWRTLTAEHDPRFGALFARRNAPLSGPPDVTIRHHFPPNWERPASGKLIIMQPWEYGHLPRDWVQGAIQCADEVWAYTRFVRDVYVRSGVPAEKVRVVPLGFNPRIFTPDGPCASVATKKKLRFLFVGGALDRKGADVLLEAYRRAFTARDDVCLIVKDMGTRTFYRAQTLAELFRRAQADPWAPEILYSDEDLSDADLAALYRACTCVVLPYRGEGFALPPLEGMACGILPIVTAGGPTDDYVDDTVALRLAYHRRLAGRANVGPFECIGDPWQLEPDLDALVDALRWVGDHPDEARARGQAARTHALAGWTWEHAGGRARERLLALLAPARKKAMVPARPWAEPKKSASKSTSARARVDPVELSLCMIARNEEPRIGSCLRSISPYLDEMIVVDTGSSDRTREVARKCGARVFELPWPDSFAAARNASLEQARGDWIFWMDADDVIPPDCGATLRQLIHRHPGKDAAYQVQVHIPPGPGEFSPSLVDHVKLFPNRPDLRFEHRIHEQILPAIRRAGLPVHFSDAYVVHQHYDRSEEGQACKRRRDFRLLELDMAENPDHPFVLFNLGMTHLYATKELEVAAHYLRRSLDRSDWRDSIVRKAYAMLTMARMCQHEWTAALAANEAGRSYYPDDAELLFQAGQLYQHGGRFDEARRALERLVDGNEEMHYRSVDAGLRTYRGWHELALLFRRMGDAPHCLRVLREITASHADYLPAQIDLVETLYSLRRDTEARELLAEMALLGKENNHEEDNDAGRNSLLRDLAGEGLDGTVRAGAQSGYRGGTA